MRSLSLLSKVLNATLCVSAFSWLQRARRKRVADGVYAYTSIVSCLTPFAEAGDDDVAATFEDAFKAIINSPNKSELLGQSSSTPATSRIRRSTIYRCGLFFASARLIRRELRMFRKVLRKSGRHGIEEKCFAIKFTRYEGSHEPIHRLRELQALEAMRGHENILTQFSYEYVCGVRACVRARLVLMLVFGLETRSEIHFCLPTS